MFTSRPTNVSETTMKAAVLRRKRLSVESISIPTIRGNELLLEVGLTGLCGTDVKKATSGMLGNGTFVLGHEMVGRIVACGLDLPSTLLGERVAVFHHVPCMEDGCEPCKQGEYAQCPTYKSVDTTAGFGVPSGGGFAQYVVLPPEVVSRGLVRIPDHVSYEQAVFLEPLNCILKAIRLFEKFGQPINQGEKILVIGQGVNGLIFTQILKRLYDAEVITLEPNEYRRKQSEVYGAIAHKAIPPDLHVSKAIVACASESAIHSAIRIVDSGGTIVYFGDIIPGLKGGTDWSALSRTETSIFVDGRLVVPSYSSAFDLHEESATLLFSGKLDVISLISHKIGLDSLPLAIKGFRTGRMYSRTVEDVLKIVVKPGPESDVNYLSGVAYYVWNAAVSIACAVAFLVVVGTGIGQFLQDKKLEDSGCVPTDVCDYSCTGDHGDIPGKAKLTRYDGTIYYWDYDCLSPP
ncbi:alcohol dehydrogenase catalytic domain-containing protein [Candidatus Micrarchaeota archaeon]|nr:alcohol dehydrogenase catalytic domain-containing protein [Candidatus Micrarchaeota archaeon]